MRMLGTLAGLRSCALFGSSGGSSGSGLWGAIISN
eukprot:COSAG05_NODE_22186_length_266_cov_0.934132_2_plen_34_part_01